MCAGAYSIFTRAAALAGVLAFSGSALAQGDPALVTALAECRALTNDRMRLACFDDVVVRVGGVTEPVRIPNEATAPSTLPAAEIAEVAERGGRRSDVEREDAAETTAAVADELAMVTIVDVIADGLGRTSFVTDDGAVYRQTDGRSSRFPETPFEAEIRPGALGSSFLVIAGGRGVRVTLRN
jgi:hypothetical protein